MWKVAVGLLVVAVLLSVVWIGHAELSGIAIPYPHPTPKLAAYESYHRMISDKLLLAAGVSWLVAGAASAAWMARWLWRGVLS